MRNLLQDADRDRLVAPLATHLAREVAVGGVAHRALAAEPGSVFFPAEANARAAELLLLPGIRERHPALSDQLLDFVVAMADAPVPCRAAVAGRAELRRADPRDLHAVTPFFRLTGDLGRGELRQGRHDAPRTEVLHSGNLVEFALGLRRSCIDVEDSVTGQSVAREGDRLVLRHVSTIRGRAGLAGRPVEAGTLEYRYEIAGNSPLLQVTIRFTAARGLSRLRVTTAADALDEAGLGGTAVRMRQGVGWRSVVPGSEPGAVDWAVAPPVAHIAIGGAAGGQALHLRPADPAHVMAVTATALHGGSLHWLLVRHGPARLRRGQVLEVRETRLLAPVGAAPVAAMMMEAGQRPEMAGLDLQPAPPSGAALHAAALALMFDATGAWATPLDPARRAMLADFVARQATRLATPEAGAEDLAYGVLAADALRRAGMAGAAGFLPGLLDALVAQAQGGLMLDAAGRPSLAVQGLALLALARAASWPEGAAGLALLGPLLQALGGPPAGTALGLRFAGGMVEAAAEAEGLALVARAAGAVVLAAEAGAPVPQALQQAGREVHRNAVGMLRVLVRPQGPALEVAPRGMTEPALQAVATLAFLAPDRLVLAAGRAGAEA